jgi:uncharacterized protein
VLTDALSSLILQQRVLPAFREGRMEAGVVAGTQAVIQQLALPDDQARAVVAKARPAPQGTGDALPVIIFVIIILFWLFGGLMRAFGGRGRGSGAWWWLPLLLSSGGGSGRGGGWGGGGGGGFSGGGGSFGGGGSSGSW